MPDAADSPMRNELQRQIAPGFRAAILADLAFEELTPLQCARVLERYELILEQAAEEPLRPAPSCVIFPRDAA